MKLLLRILLKPLALYSDKCSDSCFETKQNSLIRLLFQNLFQKLNKIFVNNYF